MNSKILIFILIGILVIPNVNAQVTQQVECKNINATHGVYTELARNTTGIANNNTFTCPGLCANNRLACDYPVQPEVLIAIIAGILGLAAIYIGASLKIPEDDNGLRLVLFFFGLGFLVVLTALITFSSDFTSNQIISYLSVVLYMVLLSFFLAVVYLFLKIFTHIISYEYMGILCCVPPELM